MNMHFKKLFVGILLALASGLIIVVVIMWFPSEGLATPRITWTRNKISETVSPQQTKSVFVSFTSSEKIYNVIVRIDPEVQPYLRIKPRMFSFIKARSVIHLTLTISAPVGAPFGTFNGTIQLKSTGKSAKTYAKPLPITLNIWKSIEDPILPYLLKYPGNWTATVRDNGFVDIIGQVTSSMPTAPGDMTGICKISVGFHDNSDLLPLSDWLQRAEIETGASPPISSDPVIIGGITGIKEVIEELGISTTVYLPKGDKIISFELLCGDDALSEGEAIFLKILDSIIFN